MSSSSKGKRKQTSSASSDRRPLRFWEPFNLWWRGELDRTGKRATADEISRWYLAQSDMAWGPEKPSLQETRTHAKCLRSVSSVREYFRDYRAKKKHEQNDLDQDMLDDYRGSPSRSTSSRRASGTSRSSRSLSRHSSIAHGTVEDAMQHYYASCSSQPEASWGSGYVGGGYGGVGPGAAAAAASGSHGQLMASAAADQQHFAGIHPGALAPTWPSCYPAAAAAVAAPPPTDLEGFRQYQQMLAATAAHAATEEAAGSSMQQQQQQFPELSSPAAGRGASLTNLFSPLQAGLDNAVVLETLAYQLDIPGLPPWLPPGAAALAAATQGSRYQQRQQQVVATEAQQADGSSSCQQQGSAEQQETKHTQSDPHPPEMAGPAAVGAEAVTERFAAAGAGDPKQQLPSWQAIEPKPSIQEYIQRLVSVEGQAGHHAAAPQGCNTQQSFTAALPVEHTAGMQVQPHHWPQAPQQHLLQQVQALLQLEAATSSPFAASKYAGTAGPGAGMNSTQANTAEDPATATGQARPGTTQAPCQGAAGNEQDAVSTAAAPGAPSAPAARGNAVAPIGLSSLPGNMHGMLSRSAAAMLPPAPVPVCPGQPGIDGNVAVKQEPWKGASAVLAGRVGHAEVSNQRFSISALLEAPGLPALCGAAAARRLSQTLEHLALPQPRMSLYAMSSGALDMFGDGLDLDAFLGTAELGGGVGVAAAGSADHIAPIAPGSRTSFRWLRPSCTAQVPENWQQQIQALDNAPFRGGGSCAAAASGSAPLAQLTTNPATSDAPSAAVLAAASQVPLNPCKVDADTMLLSVQAASSAAAAPPPPPAVQGAVTATGARRKRSHKEVEQAVPAALPHPLASGPLSPGPMQKRACFAVDLGDGDNPVAASVQQTPGEAPLIKQEGPDCTQAANLHAKAQQPDDGRLPAAACMQAPGFKYVLDLGTPRFQLGTEHQQQQEQQSVQPQEVLGTLAPQGITHQQQQQQKKSQPQKWAHILDLRPEELGMTSDTCHAAAAAAFAVPQPLGPGAVKQHAAKQGLLLNCLVSPREGAAVAAGPSSLRPHSGPATAASTTAAPPKGPNGAPLPPPALANSALAAAMAAAMAAPQLPAALQFVADGFMAGGNKAADPAKRLLPAMHEIEKMI